MLFNSSRYIFYWLSKKNAALEELQLLYRICWWLVGTVLCKSDHMSKFQYRFHYRLPPSSKSAESVCKLSIWYGLIGLFREFLQKTTQTTDHCSLSLEFQHFSLFFLWEIVGVKQRNRHFQIQFLASVIDLT